MLIVQIMSELERERAMRVYVFPRLKQQGKITETEANTRLDRMDAAIELCRTLLDAGVQTTEQLWIRLTPPADIKTRKDKYSSFPIIKGAE